MTRGFRDEEPVRVELVDVDAKVIHESESGRAWLVDTGSMTCWLPKSQCERDGLTITMPRWLAEEKGLV